MNNYQQNSRAGGQPRQVPGQSGRPRHQEQRAGDGRCTICSFTQQYPQPRVPVYHRHFSSVRARILAGVEDTTRPYLCPSCKSQHSPYHYQQTWSGQDRTKIVVSDSTLHSFFAPPNQARHQYPGDNIHVDYITIPGGDIEALTQFKLHFHFRQNHTYINSIWLTKIFYREAKLILPVLLLPVIIFTYRRTKAFF